jgi:Zn-dependent protease
VSFGILLAFFDPSKIDLIQVAHFLVALYLSISVHEAAHAWMANRCGDDTARLMGRMTLNPIVHIDPIGTVLMPALMVLSSGIPLIGWAKPVPVNPLRFHNMRRGEILVSLAGPVSNFTLAAAAVVVCWIVVAVLLAVGPGAARVAAAFLTFLRRLVILNLVLGVFNLIPIPPLDGSHVLGVFISREAAQRLERLLMPPLNFIVLLLVVVPIIGLVVDLNAVDRALERLVFIWWT